MLPGTRPISVHREGRISCRGLSWRNGYVGERSECGTSGGKLDELCIVENNGKKVWEFERYLGFKGWGRRKKHREVWKD